MDAVFLVRWCLGGGPGLDTVECGERDVGPEGAGMLDGFTRASRRNTDCIFTSLIRFIQVLLKKHSTIRVRPSLNMLKLLVVFTVCCFASRKRSDTDFLLNQLMIVFLDPVSSVVGSDDGAMYCGQRRQGREPGARTVGLDGRHRDSALPSSEFVTSQSHCCQTQSCIFFLLRTKDIIGDR